MGKRGRKGSGERRGTERRGRRKLEQDE